MNAAAFAPNHSQSYQQSSGVPSALSSMSPIGETPPFSRAPSGADLERMGIASASSTAPAILIRNLARHMTEKELRSMFLFAKDFIDSEFLAPEYFDDHTHISAIARFKSSSAAFEAKAMLDGKPNTATEANMIVEVLNNGSGSNPHSSRRPASDGMANRGPSSSSSSTGSSAGVPAPRQASRYNGTFQNMERVSPPGAGPGLSGNGDLPAPETGSHFQSLFSPQSPIGNQATERPRVTGKSVINDDSVDDDETGELLKDPVAYARNGNVAASASSARRMTGGGQPPVSRFGGLSLSTSGVVSPPNNGFASPRNALQSPGSALSPAPMSNLGPNAAYQLATQHFQRPNYPPVNPADQNPPCNTLYVGNLPIDTSEDELKAMFSKQRGYKRLCFRTKQNGPMCFVEFEDVSFATKALNELYGHPLHNSVKGGIRLSFSKNPLGVRTGQPGNGVVGLSSPSSSHGNMPGMSGIMAGGPPGGAFGTATGPPPGLSAPPGLQSPTAGMPGGLIQNLAGPINGSMISGTYGNNPFGMNGGRHSAMTGGISTGGGGHAASMHGGGGFGEYMMGR